MEEQLAKKRQIFAPQEAYKMLANELERMMIEAQDGVHVDAVNYSVWHWDMFLTNFSPSTAIAQVRGFQGNAFDTICSKNFVG